MASYEAEAELQKLYEERAKLFDQMNKSAKTMLGIFQQIEKTMKDSPMSEAAEETDAWGNALTNAAGRVTEMNQDIEDMFNEMSDALPGTTKMMTDLSNNLDKIGSKGIVFTSLLAGLNGFHKGLKLSVSAMGSLWNVTKNVGASLGHVALSIISFPFKMLRGLMSMAQSGGGDNSLHTELENIRKAFGDLRTGASAAIIDIGRSMRGPLAETGLNARRIFGNLAEALATFREVATNMGPLFNRIRDQLTESADSAQRFGAYLKGLGLDTAEAQRAIAAMSVRSGKDVNELGREITTFAYGMGEAFGINGKEISRDVGKMMHDFESFGNLSIQTLTNVSIYARKLGVEVEKLKGAIGAFDDFEKAAEGAAQLSQAFGLNVDAFQLMQEQDPAARIEQLRKAFFAAGRSVENMTRQERALLAEQTGLDQETASLVFSQRNASTSYQDIQRQSEATKKKQLSQAEAMEKLADSIERMVKSGSSMQGGFFKIFFDGFTRGIMMSRDFRGLMRDLRQDMRIVFQAGRQVGLEFVRSFPGVQDMLQGLREIFNPAEWRRRMVGVKDLFGKFFRDLANPNTRGSAFGTFVNNIKEHFKDLFDANSPRGQRFLNGLKQFLRAFTNIFTSGLRVALEGVRNGLRFLTEFIRDPSAAIARLQAGASGGGSFIMTEFVGPVLQTLREVGPEIWEAIVGLFGVVKDKVMQHVGPFLPRLISLIFAPAVFNSALSTGVTAFGGLLFRIFGGSMIDRFFSREGKESAQAVSRGASGILESAANRVSEATRGTSPGEVAGTARTVSAASPVVEASSGLGQATPSTTPNPANLVKMAAFIAVGVVAVVGAVIALAYLIRATSLTLGDIALSLFTIGGATLIVGAIAAMAVMMTAASPAGAAAPALMVPMLGLLALAAAVTLGTVGLAMLIKSQSLSAGDIGLAVLTIGGGVAILLATVLGATLLGAAGILSIGFALIAAGAASAGLFALAIVHSVNDVIKEFRDVNIAEVAVTATKIGSTLLIFGGLALLAGGLAIAGAASVIALPFVYAGLRAMNSLADAVVTSASSIIASINNIQTSAGLQQKVEMVVSVMGALSNFMSGIGDALGPTSVIAAILPGRSTMESQIRAMSQFIEKMKTSMVRMVQGVVQAINGISVNENALNRSQAIVNIIEKLGTFIGNLGQAIPSDFDTENVEGLINGMTNLFDRITDKMISLMMRTNEIVNGIASSAGTIDPAKAPLINALASSMTTIISGIANLFGTLLRTNAIQNILGQENAPVLLSQLGTFFSRVINSLRESNFFNNIGLVINAITNGVGNMNATEAANLYNLGRVLVPVLDSVRMIFGLFGSLPPNLVTGAGAELDAKLEGMSTALQSLSRGFGSSIGLMVGALVDSFDTLKPEQIRPLAAKIRPLQGLFNLVKTLTETLTTIGGENVNPNTVMSALEKTYQVILGDGWSLLNFSMFSKERFSALDSALADAAIVQALGSKTQAYVTGLTGTIQGFGPLFQESFTGTINAAQTANLKGIETIINDYTQFVTRINSDLLTLASKQNNVSVGLTRLRDRLGLGGRQRSSLQLNNMTVNINVEVKLRVDDIEQAIATRAGGSTFTINKDPGNTRIANNGGTRRDQDVYDNTGTTS